MASVTYGKHIMASVIMENVFIEKVYMANVTESHFLRKFWNGEATNRINVVNTLLHNGFSTRIYPGTVQFHLAING